jgi:hypothetical protein
LDAIALKVDAQKNIVNVGKWEKNAVNIVSAQIARIYNEKYFISMYNDLYRVNFGRI